MYTWHYGVNATARDGNTVSLFIVHNTAQPNALVNKLIQINFSFLLVYS